MRLCARELILNLIGGFKFKEAYQLEDEQTLHRSNDQNRESKGQSAAHWRIS